MTASSRCAQCGAELGPGRYCTSCGRPVEGEWRTDTAERPPVPPTVVGGAGVPPPAFEPPPRARYPLFADEAGGGPGAGQSPPTVAVPAPSYAPPPAPPEPYGVPVGSAAPSGPSAPSGPGAPGPTPTSHRRRRGALPWVVGVLAVVLLAVVGTLLLVGGDDDDGGTADDPAPAASEQPSTTAPSSSAPPSSEPPPSPAPSTPAPVKREDLTGTASISAPVTAPPGTDVQGNPVTYRADNMLDGNPATAWRMPGDGAGTEITIDFGGPTQLERVGLVNGYAKRDPGYDGYTANRRITRVVWRFDDGTEQAQILDQTRRMQVLDVGPVTTTRLTLRIVTVTPPGRGRQGRDYTAISDLALRGGPAA